MSRVFEVRRYRVPLSVCATGRHQAQGEESTMQHQHSLCYELRDKMKSHKYDKESKSQFAEGSRSVAAEEARQAYGGDDIIVSGDCTSQ